MTVWLCRAGQRGEYETRFLEEKRIYRTTEIPWDMSEYPDRESLLAEALKVFPDQKTETVRNWAYQDFAFTHMMQVDDLVVLPSKIKPVYYFGTIRTGYNYDKNAEEPYWHYREVDWINEVKKSEFDQDLRYSFGAAQTICKIWKNDAENRIRAILTGNVKPLVSDTDDEEFEDYGQGIDLEQNAFDEIGELLIKKFKGHGLTDIVAAILEAKGFKTYVSPPGPDQGVDILAAPGSLGFDHPRICVQVKSGDDAVGSSVHDQLIGAMNNHKAEYGLLVSWGGFKNSVLSKTASHFFTMRLWDHRDVINELLKHYEDLPEEIRDIVPLKKIWIIDKQ